jgi:hypothetical protein
MAELYKWCVSCGKEETVNEKEPKTVYGGTDGYGQPVRFSECECGSNYGWFNIGFYRYSDDFVFDEGFKSYLQSRIKHYFKLNDEQKKMVKDLKDNTGFGMWDCRRALIETSFDAEMAKRVMIERHKATSLTRLDGNYIKGE